MKTKKIHISVGAVGIVACLLILGSLGCATTQKRQGVTSEPVVSKEKVFFGFNKSQVTTESRGILEKVASRLKERDKPLAILVGHTDLIGSVRYNEILAEKRARSVRVALRDLGVDPARMTILSKGKREPAVKGYTPWAGAANRRVEIMITLQNQYKEKRKS